MADEYIRREDAKDALQEKVFHNLTDEFYGAMQAIDELPSADVVPVVHAHWINYRGNYVSMDAHGCVDGECLCSACGDYLTASDEYGARGFYCPNCGAKMDEEVPE